MAETFKVLAQAKPAATTLDEIYEVPLVTSTVVSTIVVCNRGAVDDTFRISIGVGGAADAPEQYTHYDAPILANDTLTITIGATLAAGDILRAYSGLGNVAFTAFGVENA